MDTADAFQIVIDLAKENQLQQSEILQDPEVLQPLADRQQEALNIVEDFVTNHLGDD